MDFDLTQIGAFANAVSTALKVTGEAAGTLKSIKDLVNKVETNDRSEIDDLLNKLATQLTVANLQNLQLSEELKQVTDTIIAANDFQSRLSRYEEFHTSEGDIVLKLREEFFSNGKGHYVCPVCVEKSKQFHFVTGRATQTFFVCQSCKTGFSFNPEVTLGIHSGIY